MAHIRREWRCDVTVTLAPGRDVDGHVRPGQTLLIEDAPVAPGASEEAGYTAPPSEATEDLATVYAPPGTPPIPSTATVTIPDTHLLAGDWMVVGTPKAWGKGRVIALRRIK